MQITCPNCKKSYAINSEKIPPNITTAKCKACGHRMPLKSEPPKKLSPATNTYNVTCHYCSRKYSLDPSKIPPKVTKIKCKACGHAIPLKQHHADTTSPDEATNRITCQYCRMVKCFGASEMEWPHNLHFVVVTFFGILLRSIV